MTGSPGEVRLFFHEWVMTFDIMLPSVKAWSQMIYITDKHKDIHNKL